MGIDLILKRGELRLTLLDFGHVHVFDQCLDRADHFVVAVHQAADFVVGMLFFDRMIISHFRSFHTSAQTNDRPGNSMA
ncbi:hypothetical protein D1872_331080 [compost metagenome]